MKFQLKNDIIIFQKAHFKNYISYSKAYYKNNILKIIFHIPKITFHSRNDISYFKIRILKML